MVTSRLLVEVPMFPSKAVPLQCNRSLHEALIRHDVPKRLCMRVGRTVTSDGFRNLPFQEQDHLDPPSVARIHQAADGPAGSAGDSSSVLKIATRIGSIAQPRIRLYLRT
jgi:hypothetical protein